MILLSTTVFMMNNNLFDYDEIKMDNQAFQFTFTQINKNVAFKMSVLLFGEKKCLSSYNCNQPVENWI